MNTIGWRSLMGKKFISIILVIGLIAFWAACTDDSVNLNGVDDNASAKTKANINSTSAYSDYTIAVDVSSDGSEWTYTITKKEVSSTTGRTAKDISHLIINLQNCVSDPDQSATFSDILYATVNGEPANFVSSEGSGTGCNPESVTTNFVKIDDIVSASSWVIVIKYDRGYEKVLTNGWIKAGSTCTTGQIYGPGCPITEQCAYGQGYFFANGYDNNGSVDMWPLVNENPTLTIGGFQYSPEETHSFWDVNTGQGQSDEMKAFFQLGALKLSNVAPTELLDEMETIENYFAALQAKVAISTCSGPGQGNSVYECFNLPDNKAVSDAAGTIGEWIGDNKCPGDDSEDD